MLHQENKIFIMLISILLLFSCNKYKKYDDKEIADIRERVLVKSQSILGKDVYYSIYQMANDSIVNWGKHGLEPWKSYTDKTIREYQLDSVFCVNSAGDKIIFSILKRTPLKEDVADGISYFYGVKIRNTWYFLNGPGLVLLREWYQKDVYTSLSFEIQKQIATSNIYRGYLIKNKQGEWVINDNFFSDIIPSKETFEIYNLKNEEEYAKFMVELNWSSDVNATLKKYQKNESCTR